MLLALASSFSVVHLYILVVHVHHLGLRHRVVFWNIVCELSSWIVDQIHDVSPIVIDIVVDGGSQ